ncbi:hypothetical protein GW17_00021563 [Ensete ventricosum]|nr:hypothetical protein GW17_00021563 [Ensete ventricosum]
MEGCVDRLSANEVTCVASTPAWGPNTAFTGAVTAALPPPRRLTTLSSLSLLPRKEYNNRGSHEAPPPHKSIPHPPESNHRSREGERIGAERPSSVDAMQYHAYNRLGGGGGGGTPSPPASPRRSPRIHRRAGKGGGGGRTAQGPPRTIAQRMAWMLLSFLLRRQAIFLFAPLLYVAAMLFYMGTVPIDSVPRIISRSAPGSVYRSPKLYERLRPAMDADNSSDGDPWVVVLVAIKVFHTDLYRPYRAVHTGPPGYQYADRSLLGGTAKIDCRRSIEGEKGKKKKKRKRRKKKKKRRRRIPRVVLARVPSPPTGDFSPAQGERSRRRRRGKKKKKKRRRRIPHVVLARAPSPPASRPRTIAARGRFFSLAGRKIGATYAMRLR